MKTLAENSKLTAPAAKSNVPENPTIPRGAQSEVSEKLFKELDLNESSSKRSSNKPSSVQEPHPDFNQSFRNSKISSNKPSGLQDSGNESELTKSFRAPEPLKRRPSCKPSEFDAGKLSSIDQDSTPLLKTRPSVMRKKTVNTAVADKESSLVNAAEPEPATTQFLKKGIQRQPSKKDMQDFLESNRQQLRNISESSPAPERLTASKKAESAVIPENINRKELIKLRWLMAYNCVCKSLGTSTKSNTTQMIIESKLAMESSLSSSANHNVVSFAIAKNEGHSAKILEILSKPEMYRSAEKLNALESILKTFPGFSKYSRIMRFGLMSKGTIFKINQHRMITKQKGEAWGVYFIISGKCKSESIIIKRNRGFVKKRDYFCGDAFGEIVDINNTATELRTETVISLTNVDLFFVSRKDYIDLMKADVMMKKSEKLETLKTFSAFGAVSAAIIEKFLGACQVFKYEANAPILKMSDREKIFFILQGKCRANRLVPFLVKTGVKNIENAEISNAYKPGATVPYGEEVIYHNLSIGSLGPGDIFPRINLLRSEVQEYKLDKFPSEKLVILLNAILRSNPKQPKVDKNNIIAIASKEVEDVILDLEDSIAGVDLSVFATEAVQCLAISRKELISIFTEDMLSDVTSTEYEGLIGISIDEIQQNYFEKIQWKGLRQDMIKNGATGGNTAIKKVGK